VGDVELLDTPGSTLAWVRRAGDDERIVVLNMNDLPAELDLQGTIEVASDRVGEGAPFRGTLAADAAVILRP
jgi:alpha-glucosidase